MIQDDALLFGFEDEDDFEESDRMTGDAGEASGSKAPAIIAEDLPAAIVEAQAARLEQVRLAKQLLQGEKLVRSADHYVPDSSGHRVVAILTVA